jgi:hypothetical protein
MALVVKDRVQEATTTSGTGTLTFSGPIPGYQSFSSAIGNGNTTFYTIYDNTAQAWEVGIGTVGAGTLARTTVLSNSSGTTSPISLVGNSSLVFCTYPAEKSINYDANDVATIGDVLGYSDTGIVGSFASTVAGYNQVIVQNKSTATNASSNLNVSNDAGTAGSNYAELGINSSTFTGSGSFNIAGASYVASASTDLTIGTYGAYSVHFVTNSNTTDSMTIFNNGGISLGGFSNPGIGNMAASKFVPGYSAITSAAGTTVLTASSNYYQHLLGSTTQTFRLPDATTLLVGTTFIFDNDSSGILTVVDNASGAIETIPGGGSGFVYLAVNSTVAGTWRKHAFLPASYDFNATTANFGTATITNATWNGNTIGTAYGGTGLTTFSAANYALYSTSASTLVAGTLPVAAGGTGTATAFTTGSVVFAGASGTYTQDNANFFWDDTNNRLGIGTSAPIDKVDVLSTIWARSGGTTGTGFVGAAANNYASLPSFRATYLAQQDSATTGTTAGISNVNLGILAFQNTNNALIYTNGGTPLIFGTTNVERMRITSAGDVGIGTTSPGVKLQVNSSVSNIAKFYGNNANNWIELSDNNGTNSATLGSIAGGNWYLYTTGFGAFYTGGTEKMRITSAGNVGIGTGAPWATQAIRFDTTGNGIVGDVTTARQLSVGSSSTYQIALGYYQTGVAQPFAGVLQSLDNGNGISLLLNPSGGNVGIGTTSPAVKLSISSTDAMLVPVGTTGQRPTGAAGYFRYNSTLTAFEGYNGTAWSTLGNPTIQNTAPSSPVSGNQWWDSEYGRTNIYYNDGTSSQWVAGQPSPDGILLDSLDGGSANTASYSRFIINCGAAT